MKQVTYYVLANEDMTAFVCGDERESNLKPHPQLAMRFTSRMACATFLANTVPFSTPLKAFKATLTIED